MVLKIRLYVRPVTDLKQPKPPFSPNPKQKSLPEKDSTDFQNSKYIIFLACNLLHYSFIGKYH